MSPSTSRKSSTTSNTTSIKQTYSRSGIGGAGNFRPSSELLPAYPSTPITPRTTGIFSTSIGGAGNHRDLKDRQTITLPQRIQREEVQRRAAAKNWHHGIGGAGNTAGVENRWGSFDNEEGYGSVDRKRDSFAGFMGWVKGGKSSASSSVESLALKE